MRRFIAAAALMLSPAPALAGGVGILATGGLHNEPVYFYSSRSTLNDQAYQNLSDYEQFRTQQLIPQLGGGFEVLLGDARDDRIVGSIRFFYNADLPQRNPVDLIDGNVVATNAASNVEALRAENVVGAYRTNIRSLGFAMIGLSWGLVGDPDGFQLAAVGHVGTALLTLDHTEFFMAQAGPGITYRFSRQTQLFADAQYQARFRKTFSHAVSGTVGLRYLFD
ncbi:MAG: hypothetical protein AAGA48_16760 [Myxococcota bacterium]